MFCKNCGREISDEAVICPGCGCAVVEIPTYSNPEGKNWVAAYLLCWFLGCFGAHRFYMGQIGTAVAQLFTLGGCGVWALIDFIRLSFNTYSVDGKKPEGYLQILGIIGFAVFILGILAQVFFGAISALIGD